VIRLTRGDNAGGRIEEIETSREEDLQETFENTRLRDALGTLSS
jgi:hypothetical protein